MSPDTIIAPATPPGTSALALIRVSGPEARAVVGTLLRKPVPWQPQRVYYRELFSPADGSLLDEVVLTFWQAPHSFTGEDLVEVSCHGNPLLVSRLLAACLAFGPEVRSARAGEFARRAFLNGKIDLTQAEAIGDLLAAGTDREIAGAQAMRAGRLGERIGGVRERIIDLLANLEAWIDFPDEDISPETGAAFAARVREAEAEVARLIATAPLGRILRQGIPTALVGAPNAGKSSLFNALLREDRAIVSPIPGTTRDVIETEARVGSLRLRLLDTAGHRETGDAVEAEGVRRAHRAAEGADLILHLFEASVPREARDFPMPAEGLHPGQVILPVATKADLGIAPENEDYLAVSVVTGAGLDQLARRIEVLLLGANLSENDDPLTVNTRQEGALRAAQAAFGKALEGLGASHPPELTSLALREAAAALAAVVGETTNEDVLDALFLKFCIGK
ncbi:tRNA modification GTPase trmE [Verrucomicrobium sp. GAS474]|uniref:tRNA uridine-5-carboxymethylaminomethyl(34) synthesis GTPase MnmE n=1 Tax=Verrucomicrobium sp. GAS474 TaxID=1882831 RepID=UPI00087CF8A2|nr:tRNA uridine-5-carboxymethylaminomethyl(34) synthesis GTPase MnmE [Verrucomicrobium sp. GAS474]SDT86526.1 tRNA modification GTPase trmE [Verrucomicrobium sp. GAS474]